MEYSKAAQFQITKNSRFFVLGLLIVMSSCRLHFYKKSKEDLSECVAGVKMPADEFCVKWNNHYFRSYARVEKKLRRLRKSNQSKRYEAFKAKIYAIDQEYSHIKGLSDDGEL